MRISKEEIRDTIREDRNGLCVMMEGMFNNLGIDIIDMTTIIPLFLSFLGASLQTIGALTTMRSILASVVPLLLGGYAAAFPSKRNFSLIYNGSSRAAILLIALGLFIGLPARAELILFFAVIAYYSFCQPLTGLAWNYLIGAYMRPEKRATMLGILYSVSGVLIFLSSGIIKAIRSNENLSGEMQYAWIFLIGGLLVATSVLWYLPLREDKSRLAEAHHTDAKEYIRQLLGCYRNQQFRKAIYAILFSNTANNINTFFFLFVQDSLKLSQQSISDLIIVQTFGVMVGGFVTGWISQRFSVKRMLQTLEGLGLFVPVMGLLAMNGGSPMVCSVIALFIIGFMKGGLVGYSAYILEIIPSDRTVYYVVARSLSVIPISFLSILAGDLIARFGNMPIFIAQTVICLCACFFVSRLQRNVYR